MNIILSFHVADSYNLAVGFFVYKNLLLFVYVRILFFIS